MADTTTRRGYLEQRSTRHRRRRRSLALLVLSLVLIAPLATESTIVDRGTSTVPFVTTASVPTLAFDIPQQFSSPKMVFAHYFPPYPFSIDNAPPNSDYYATQYLTPGGENGKHAAYGGWLRDRPFPIGPRSGDYRLANLQLDIAAAASRGIDGFSVDILTRSSSTANPVSSVPMQLMKASATMGSTFKIMLMPDMNGELGSLAPADLAAELNQYAGQSSVYRLADGRLVVSPFLAEKHPPSWWAQFITIMKASYNQTVAFVPLFLDAPSNIDAYASVSYGMSNWGGRNPNFNPVTNTGPNSPRGVIDRVRGMGKIWMQPVSLQDSRPAQGIYDEAQNSQNLRNTWRIATESGSEWVQLTTWNDYSEGAVFQPSANHVFAPLDINAYYLTKFKTGVDPPIVRDTLYLSHRTQFAAARPSYPQSRLMQLRPGSSPARDTVEVLTFLTAPAQILTLVGRTYYSCNAPAGVGTCVFPLEVGKVGAIALRGGQTVAAVATRLDVTANPYVQNLDYTFAGSR